MRIGNLRGGGRVVKTLLGFCPCYRHRPQPAPTRPPWLGERLFRTSCAKIAAHHTKSQQSLNSTYTSTPIPYPHKPHHPTTTARVCNPQPTNHISKTTREGAKRPTLNHTSHPSTTARVCKHPTLEGKNSPGWWAGCGCMV